MFSYEINGKNYTQKPLTMGQTGQLLYALEGVQFDSSDPLSIMLSIGERITTLLAIVLTPEGVTPDAKNLQQVQSDMFNADLDTGIKVIEDFFICNPLPSLSGKLEKLAVSMGTGLTTQSVS